MKIQLNTNDKTIKIEESVNICDLFKFLDKLLPKDSPIGYWKDFKLETNTTITYWNNPIYVPFTSPFYYGTANPILCPPTFTCCAGEITSGTLMLTNEGHNSLAIGTATNGIYNIQTQN